MRAVGITRVAAEIPAENAADAQGYDGRRPGGD